MSEQDGQPKELESEKILKDIESLKKESKKPVLEAQKTPEPTQSVEEPAPKGQAEGQEMAPKEDKPENDIREWAKKKGIKDADSALRSLRELEKKFGKVTAELKSEKEVPRGNPTPYYQPQPQFNQPPPYSGYPVDRERMLEQEAKRYNMAPEDFERVLSLSNDIAAMQTRRLKAEFDSQLHEITRETRRSAEFNELMSDPLFTNEEVQFEMHRVLEENPKAFALEPSPHLYAFNEAQKRIARRLLQNERQSNGTETRLPTNPPQDGNRGTGATPDGSKSNQAMDAFLMAKTAEDKRKILESMGAVKDW